MRTLSEAARLLGGEVSNGQVLCPGPGHSAKDRVGNPTYESKKVRPCRRNHSAVTLFNAAAPHPRIPAVRCHKGRHRRRWQPWFFALTCVRHLVQLCSSVMKIEGLPVIEVDESEEITVAVRADDLLEGDTADPKQHPIAIALRRQDDVDDARVTKNETLVRRGKKWFRYDAPDKRLFK